jgi:ribosome maturation factor RimP
VFAASEKKPFDCLKRVIAEGLFAEQFQFIELVDIILVLLMDGLSAHFLFVEPERMLDLHTLLDETLQQIGYEMVDLEISGRGKLIRLFIDKPGGVNIDDCALVSEHVSNLLAVEHDVDYDRLEVSSPGLDRVLKKISDFTRFAGNKVVVKLRVPVEGRKNFTGILRGIEQDMVQVETEAGMQAFALSNIDKARLDPEF